MKYLIILVSSIFLTSCASIFSSSTTNVNFDANEKDATLYINEREYGQIPQSVVLKNDKNYSVRVEKEGFKPSHYELGKTVNLVTVLNIFFWPGFIIDFATGSFYKLEEDNVYFRLNK